MLTGKAKTDYQREYMRKRRSNARSNNNLEPVRPEQSIPVRPKLARPDNVNDNQWAYIQHKAEQTSNSPEPSLAGRTQDKG